MWRLLPPPSAPLPRPPLPPPPPPLLLLLPLLPLRGSFGLLRLGLGQASSSFSGLGNDDLVGSLVAVAVVAGGGRGEHAGAAVVPSDLEKGSIKYIRCKVVFTNQSELYVDDCEP